MDPAKITKSLIEKQISVEEVNRVLDIGRLLFSVLTPSEIEAIQATLVEVLT